MSTYTITYSYKGREYAMSFPARSERWARLMAPLQLMSGAEVLRVELAI
jgi:hypothetical protein